MANPSELKASIVVCAHNAEARITETIRHLCTLKFDGAKPNFEIVIVDNASTDSTREKTLKAFHDHNYREIGWKLVVEERPGLAYARRKGILEASGELVVFVDDDNWLEDDYLCRSIDHMERDPSVGVLGGASVPAFEGTQPTWFYSYAPFFAVGVQGLRTGDITGRSYVWGAGMVIRRGLLAAFYSLNGELQLVGRTKKEALAGDDSEICKLYLLGGYKLAYDDGLTLRHFMPRRRMTIDNLEAMIRGGKTSVNVLRMYDVFVVIFSAQYRQCTQWNARLRVLVTGLIAVGSLDCKTINRVIANVRLIRRLRHKGSEV